MLNMLALNSPQTPAVIRARLTDLRKRKAFLDDLIQSVERYTEFVSAQSHPGGRVCSFAVRESQIPFQTRPKLL